MTAGRKKLYDPNTFPLLGERFARQGLNDKQIAKNLGIALSAYYNYQNQYVEFLEALKRGKHPVDIEVENSLLKRALGFEYEEKHTEIEIGSDGQPKPAKIKTVKKFIPGDTTAMIFWLKNRNPENWRDVNIQELTGKNGKEISIIVQSKECSDEINKLS